MMMTLGICLIAFGSLAQEDKKATKKKAKSERKIEREKSYLQNKMKQLALVKNKQFIIEAHTLIDRNFRRTALNPSSNFVKVEGDKGVVQFGNDAIIGPNNMGGFTLKGKISNYKVHEGFEEGPVSVSLQIVSTVVTGPTTVTITIFEDNEARARVIGPSGNRFSFEGKFLPLEGSAAYETHQPQTR